MDKTFYAALAAQAIVEVRHRLLDLLPIPSKPLINLPMWGKPTLPTFCRRRLKPSRLKSITLPRNGTTYSNFASLAALVGQTRLAVRAFTGNLERSPAIDEDQITESHRQRKP